MCYSQKTKIRNCVTGLRKISLKLSVHFSLVENSQQALQHRNKKFPNEYPSRASSRDVGEQRLWVITLVDDK